MFKPSRSKLKSSQLLSYHFYILYYIAILFGISSLRYNHKTQTIEISKKKFSIRNMYHKTFIFILVTGTLVYEFVFTDVLIELFQNTVTVKAQELLLVTLHFHLACISSLTMVYNLRVRRRSLVKLLRRLISLRRRLKLQCFQCWNEQKFYVGCIYLRWISVLFMLPNSNMIQVLKGQYYFQFHGSYYIIVYEICFHAYFLHSLIVFSSYKILNKFLREKFDKRRYSDLTELTKLYYCLDQAMNMGATFAPFLLCIFSRFIISAIELYQTLKCTLYVLDPHAALRLQKFGRGIPIIFAQLLDVLLLSLISDNLLTEKQIFIDRLTVASTRLVALRGSAKKVIKLEAEFDMTTLFSKLTTYEICAYDTFLFSRRTYLGYITIIASVTIPSLQYFVAECYVNRNKNACDFNCIWGSHPVK